MFLCVRRGSDGIGSAGNDAPTFMHPSYRQGMEVNGYKIKAHANLYCANLTDLGRSIADGVRLRRAGHLVEQATSREEAF